MCKKLIEQLIDIFYPFEVKKEKVSFQNSRVCLHFKIATVIRERSIVMMIRLRFLEVYANSAGCVLILLRNEKLYLDIISLSMLRIDQPEPLPMIIEQLSRNWASFGHFSLIWAVY